MITRPNPFTEPAAWHASFEDTQAQGGSTSTLNTETGDSPTVEHQPWCNSHQVGDEVVPGDTGFCEHRIDVCGFVVVVSPDIADGRLTVEPWADRRPDQFTATEARRIANAFTEAALIVDGAALPTGTGITLAPEQVAMLAGVSAFTVRDAIERAELKAHKAVDGTPRLVIAYDDATAWAKAQREPLPCDGWDSCPTPWAQARLT